MLNGECPVCDGNGCSFCDEEGEIEEGDYPEEDTESE